MLLAEKLKGSDGSLSMGTCSYTWKERDGEKQCQKETWKGSDEFCIFHDPSPDKDRDLFKKKLEEQMESDTDKHNFIGYYFPENWDFSGKEFKVDANFKEAKFQKINFSGVIFQDSYFYKATFQGTADFREATFQTYSNFRNVTFKGADFSKAKFQGNADFTEAIFQTYAYFYEATFQGTADFPGVTFRYANFSEAIFKDSAKFDGTIFQKETEFTPKNNEKIDLRYAKFSFRTFIIVDLSKTLFYRAFIENIAFDDSKWPNDYIIYEEKHMNDKEINLSFNQLETIYRDLKQNMQNHGNYDTAGKFYYREMEMKRKGSDSKKNRLWLKLYNLLAGYGEKPERTAISAFVIILLFNVLYWVLDCLQYPMGNPTFLEQIGSTLYFSFVTFTTLGLGDIEPKNFTGRALICCEAIIGAFLIALFVVVFARKMMR